MIWVNVTLPPPEEHPSYVKGKTVTPTLTSMEVRRRKVEALQFCVAFAYAVKHYLRAEDGTDYDDLAEVLPPRFARFDEVGYNTSRGHVSTSYAAVDNDDEDSESAGQRSPDATKRVRRKRSKKALDGRIPGSATPLLGNSHQTIEFHPYAERLTTPLPLM